MNNYKEIDVPITLFDKPRPISTPKVQESQNTEDHAKPQSREQQMKNFKDNLIEPDDLLTRNRSNAAATTNPANDENASAVDDVRGESVVLNLNN